MHALGRLSRQPGFVVAVLARQLDRPVDAIWRTLAESPALWLAPGVIEPRVGGRVRLDFEGSGAVVDSVVTAFEPGRLLAFSWSQPGEPERPVRLALAADGTLTLAVATPDGEDAAKTCAGWEAHLAMLEAALADAPIGFPFEVFKAARETYRPLVAAL
jgi:uncharacterized protein YndB with AHSA1/START domain